MAHSSGGSELGHRCSCIGVSVHHAAESADDRMPEEPPRGGHGSGMRHIPNTARDVAPHHGGAFNHAGVPSSMIGATRTRPTAACRPCSPSRCRHRCCRFCCCCRRRARAGRLACGSRTSRGSARVQTLAHWRVRPRRPRRRALAAVAGRGRAQGSPLQLTTFARAHWTRRSWSGSAMALPGPAKVPPREVGWRF